jgi:hypothetical protein
MTFTTMKTLTLILLALSITFLAAAEPSEWIGKTIPRIDLRTGVTYENATIREVTKHGLTIEHEGKQILISRYALREEAAKAMGFGDAGMTRIMQGTFRVVKVMKNGNMIVRQHHLASDQSGSFARLMSEISESSPEPARDGTQYFMRGATDFPVADREIFFADYVTTEETEDLPTVEGDSVRMRVVHLLKSRR